MYGHVHMDEDGHGIQEKRSDPLELKAVVNQWTQSWDGTWFCSLLPSISSAPNLFIEIRSLTYLEFSK